MTKEIRSQSLVNKHIKATTIEAGRKLGRMLRPLQTEALALAVSRREARAGA